MKPFVVEIARAERREKEPLETVGGTKSSKSTNHDREDFEGTREKNVKISKKRKKKRKKKPHQGSLRIENHSEKRILKIGKAVLARNRLNCSVVLIQGSAGALCGAFV